MERAVTSAEQIVKTMEKMREMIQQNDIRLYPACVIIRGDERHRQRNFRTKIAQH